ncbi:MAG TPA: DUF1501 domain-containing protein, partial [Pirellulales bacterium]|nr:DUF1501 domain-containing protein [Pirellulales bacterium]
MMPYTQSFSRRRFLGSNIAGALALACSPVVQRALAQKGRAKRAKACILLWLNGGPSHLDTFDPKPGAATGGPFQAIDTSVAGLQICQHLPELAKQAQHLALIRSLTSKEADHGRANYFLHTGNNLQPSLEYPTLGSVVAKTSSDDESDLPAFVSMGSIGFGNGPGFFCLDFAPYVIGDLNAPVPNAAPPEEIDADRRTRRLASLERFNGNFARRVDQPVAAGHSNFTGKALRLMSAPGMKAFDLAEESAETQAAYRVDADGTGFGRSCLMARRLVEQGVKFVEVALDGWDTHADNFNAVAALSGQLDGPMAALLADLAQRGLLAETLVVCMGEFGRTPAINGMNGRDHWSDAFSAILAGGGVRGGQVIGATDDRGEQVADRPVTVPDFFATLLHSIGIEPGKEYRTPEGRPIKLAAKA